MSQASPEILARRRLQEATATARYLGADVPLAELPTGIRYRFHTYQDQSGHFTRVSYLCDEFTRLAVNHITGRVIAMNADKGDQSCTLRGRFMR